MKIKEIQDEIVDENSPCLIMERYEYIIPGKSPLIKDEFKPIVR
jgi:hypothetical protein